MKIKAKQVAEKLQIVFCKHYFSTAAGGALLIGISGIGVTFKYVKSEETQTLYKSCLMSGRTTKGYWNLNHF